MKPMAPGMLWPEMSEPKAAGRESAGWETARFAIQDVAVAERLLHGIALGVGDRPVRHAHRQQSGNSFLGNAR